MCGLYTYCFFIHLVWNERKKVFGKREMTVIFLLRILFYYVELWKYIEDEVMSSLFLFD